MLRRGPSPAASLPRRGLSIAACLCKTGREPTDIPHTIDTMGFVENLS